MLYIFQMGHLNNIKTSIILFIIRNNKNVSNLRKDGSIFTIFGVLKI